MQTRNMQLEQILNNLLYADNQGWNTLPDWARFFISLGSAIGSDNSKNRLVIGIAVPTRSYAVSLIAAGIVIARSAVPVNKLGAEEHFAYLRSLEVGTPVTFRSGIMKKKGFLVGCKPKELAGSIQECIGVQSQSKDSGGLIEWFPPKRSLKIQVSQTAINRLPNRQKGRRIVSREGFLENILGLSDVYEFALNSRFECAIVGNKNRLRQEIKETRFAIQVKKGYFEGTLQDILRVRKLLGSEKGFRSDIYPSSGKKSPDLSKFGIPAIAIFDGALGFLKWRDYWRESKWVVLLDHTERGFMEAVDLLNQEYMYRVDEEWRGRIPNRPRNVELIVFEAGY